MFTITTTKQPPTDRQIQGHHSQGHPPNTQTCTQKLECVDQCLLHWECMWPFCLSLSLYLILPPSLIYILSNSSPSFCLSHFHFVRLSSRLCASGPTKRTATKQCSPVTGAYHDEWEKYRGERERGREKEGQGGLSVCHRDEAGTDKGKVIRVRNVNRIKWMEGWMKLKHSQTFTNIQSADCIFSTRGRSYLSVLTYTIHKGVIMNQ